MIVPQDYDRRFHRLQEARVVSCHLDLWWGGDEGWNIHEPKATVPTNQLPSQHSLYRSLYNFERSYFTGQDVRRRAEPSDRAVRCRANMAHVRQSRPDSGLDFQVKVFKTLSVVPPSLESGAGFH